MKKPAHFASVLLLAAAAALWTVRHAAPASALAHGASGVGVVAIR